MIDIRIEENTNEKMKQYRRSETNSSNIGDALEYKDRNLLIENKIVPEYVPTKLAASILGISENALRIRVCRGEIPAHKLGRSLRFRPTEIACLFKPKE